MDRVGYSRFCTFGILVASARLYAASLAVDLAGSSSGVVCILGMAGPKMDQADFRRPPRHFISGGQSVFPVRSQPYRGRADGYHKTA